MFDGTVNIKWMILLEVCGALGEKFILLLHYIFLFFILRQAKRNTWRDKTCEWTGRAVCDVQGKAE